MHIMPVFEQIKKFGLRRLGLQIVSAGLVVLILWNIISTATLFSGLNATVKHQENTDRDKPKTQGIDRLTLNYKLFGDYVPQNLDAAGIRQSMLNLTVVGVLFAVDEKDSQVMLKKANGQEEFFQVGDELPGGGTIKRITEEGVLVLRDGELERLSLPKQELIFEAPLKLDSDDAT